jgi:hypothetical protein
VHAGTGLAQAVELERMGEYAIGECGLLGSDGRAAESQDVAAPALPVPRVLNDDPTGGRGVALDCRADGVDDAVLGAT